MRIADFVRNHPAAGFIAVGLLVLVGAATHWWSDDFVAFAIVWRIIVLGSVILACCWSFVQLRNRHEVPAIPCAACAVGLSMLSVLSLFGGTSALLPGLLLATGTLAGVGVWWCEDFLVQPCDSSPLTGIETSSIRTEVPVEGGSSDSPGELLTDDYEEAGPFDDDQSAQWWVRKSADDTHELIEGRSLLRFDIGQKETITHVTFWPPLSGVSEVELFSEDDNVRLKAGPILPQGFRVQAQRSSQIEAPLVVACRYSLCATVSPPAPTGVTQATS